MFVKENIMKKLLKEAYKSGLRLGNNGESIYIGGIYWEMEVLRSFLKKGIHAAIIELVGRIPDVEEYFLATKEGEQMECGTYRVDATDAQNLIDITDLIILSGHDVKQRVLQNTETGQIRLINEVFIDIIDASLIDRKEGEYEPQGPYYNPKDGIYFCNNAMRFHACFRYDDRKETLLKTLEGIDLTQENEGKV